MKGFNSVAKCATVWMLAALPMLAFPQEDVEELLRSAQIEFKPLRRGLFALSLSDVLGNPYQAILRVEEVDGSRQLALAIPFGWVDSVYAELIDVVMESITALSYWREMQSRGLAMEIASGAKVGLDRRRVVLSVRLPTRILTDSRSPVLQRAGELANNIEKLIAIAAVARGVVELISK